MTIPIMIARAGDRRRGPTAELHRQAAQTEIRSLMRILRSLGLVLLGSVGLLATLRMFEAIDDRRALHAVAEWSARLEYHQHALRTATDATTWLEQSNITAVRAPYAVGCLVYSDTSCLSGYIPVSKGGILTSAKTVQLSIPFVPVAAYGVLGGRRRRRS